MSTHDLYYVVRPSALRSRAGRRVVIGLVLILGFAGASRWVTWPAWRQRQEWRAEHQRKMRAARAERQRKLNEALIEAVAKDEPSKVRELLSAGAQATAVTRGSCVFPSEPVLSMAVSSCGAETVELLLASGADPHMPGMQDLPPLHHAVLFRRNEIVKCLLKHKADPNLKSPSGRVPLSHAHDCPEVIVLLVDSGASAKELGAGFSLLHMTALRGHTDALKALLRAGADPNSRTADGVTPLDFATGDAARVLREAGAEPGKAVDLQGDDDGRSFGD